MLRAALDLLPLANEAVAATCTSVVAVPSRTAIDRMLRERSQASGVLTVGSFRKSLKHHVLL